MAGWKELGSPSILAPKLGAVDIVHPNIGVPSREMAFDGLFPRRFGGIGISRITYGKGFPALISESSRKIDCELQNWLRNQGTWLHEIRGKRGHFGSNLQEKRPRAPRTKGLPIFHPSYKPGRGKIMPRLKTLSEGWMDLAAATILCHHPSFSEYAVEFPGISHSLLDGLLGQIRLEKQFEKKVGIQLFGLTGRGASGGNIQEKWISVHAQLR